MATIKARGFASRYEGASRRRRFAAPIATFLLATVAAAGLSGCASISQKFAETASQMPGIGLPATAPERSAQQAPYPAVHDIPPPRNSVTLTNFEQQELQHNLVSARDQQQTSVGLARPTKKAKSQPVQRKIVPVSSGASIY